MPELSLASFIRFGKSVLRRWSWGFPRARKGLWLLWALAVASQLLLLIGGLGVGGCPPLSGPVIERPEPLTGGSGMALSGLTLLALALLPTDYPRFPRRQHWKLRVTFGRRLRPTPEQLRHLLPRGVRTVAHLVDWLTQRQMVKFLSALPVLYPILAELEVEEIIDRYCPTQAEVNIGAVIMVLCLNRLMAPRPLYRVAEWAGKTVLTDRLGVPATKLNDDRLGRALDAIQPHLDELWAEIVSRAIVRYDIDLSLVFYDLTSFYFEGAYRRSRRIKLGYSRDKKPGKKQLEVALNTVGGAKFPWLYQLLDGNVADVSTVQANMDRLLQFLKDQGWPADELLVVGDRAMISAEIVLAYHRRNLKYLSALRVMGDTEEALIRSVSADELNRHPLDVDGHWGVERTYTFEHDDQQVTDRALVVLNRNLLLQQRRTRARHLRQRLATLRDIANHKLNVRKYKRKAYAEDQLRKQVLQRAGGEFLHIILSGEDGQLGIAWWIDVERLRHAMVLDGKYILVTNDPRLTPSQMVRRYKQKDAVEKHFRTLKGPLRLRPVFLHRDERIEAWVFVNMLALLTYSILELQCRRRGLPYTARRVLEGFRDWSTVYTWYRDGSRSQRIEAPTPFQCDVLQALGLPEPQRTWIAPTSADESEVASPLWRQPREVPLPAR